MHPRVEEAAALVHLNNQYVSEKKARRAAISSLRCQEKFFPGKWSTAGQSRNWAIGNIANSLVEALIASRQLTIRRKLFKVFYYRAEILKSLTST
jgi:hypothetical protein